MEFKSLKNIETSFWQTRFFGIVFICLCAAIVGYSVWDVFSFAEAQRQKIYVLDGGKLMMLALSQDLSQNRPVGARKHVKRFHELFFMLLPDKNAIKRNIQRALFLVNKSDKSAFAYCKYLTEKGYYRRFCLNRYHLRRLYVVDLRAFGSRHPDANRRKHDGRQARRLRAGRNAAKAGGTDAFVAGFFGFARS